MNGPRFLPARRLCGCARNSLLVLAAVGATSLALAAEAAGAAAAPATSRLSWGGDVRIRNEYLNNAVSLTDTDPLHEQDVLRLRERVWLRATVAPDVVVNTRLTAEPREWLRPSFAGAYKGRTGFEERFVTPDTLNLKWDRVLGQPLAITVGRQDILPGELGDGWLIGDGTPADGSMTMYFDAVRLKFSPPALQTEFNLVYSVNDARPDAWLPTVGDPRSYPMAEQREEGLMVYASNQSLPGTRLDGYFLYKHDDQQTFTIAGTTKTPGDNAEIYTLGGRINGTPHEHWLYTLEAAGQFGWKQDRISGQFARRDVAAYGGQGRVMYRFRDVWNSQLGVTGELISGDKPGTTGRDEMFDQLWGRWPYWSDAYTYAMIPETNGRTAQMNNLARLGLAGAVSPSKRITLTAAYSALFAPQARPTRATNATLFSQTGHARGHYVQWVLRAQLTQALSGCLQAEWVTEGSYYRQRDTLVYLRAETTFRF